MELEFKKQYGKDWIIKNGHIELIGQAKTNFISGKEKPLKITGHRISQILGIDKFVPTAIAEAEMLGILKKITNEDANINMLTGQIAEKIIVDQLNKEYKSSGETFPFTEKNKGDVFNVSEIFSALPDYMTAASHKIFDDKSKKSQKIIEIKTTGANKWARDKAGNYMLEVLDNSLTEDNIVDNPNRDMIEELFNSLSKKELSVLTSQDKTMIKEYIKDQNEKAFSKKWFVSFINRFGIKKDMLLGDPTRNRKPILKNTKNVKVKIKVKEEGYGKRCWQKDGEYFARDEYVFQVALYTFLHQVKQNPNIKPEDLAGEIETEIDVLFVDDDQFVVPKDNWFNNFNYQPSKPKKIELNKHNFKKIKATFNLHQFYETVIKPCKEVWDATIKLQKTQDIDVIGWAILKKAFLQNGYSINQFSEIQKSNVTSKINLVKKTVKKHHYSKTTVEKDKLEKKKLLDLFYKTNTENKKVH